MQQIKQQNLLALSLSEIYSSVFRCVILWILSLEFLWDWKFSNLKESEELMRRQGDCVQPNKYF